MNFIKIQELIESKNFTLKDFVPKHTSLKPDGFRLSLIRETLTVKNLISVSKGLGVPVSSWFKEDDAEILKDTGKIKEHSNEEYLIEKVELLEKQIQDKEKLIIMLEEKICQLDPKSKALGCG